MVMTRCAPGSCLAGCSMALVSTGTRPFLSLLAQTSKETTPLPFRGTILQFSVRGVFAVWRTLTIESLLMSGHGQGCEPSENVLKKPWLTFPVPAPSRSGNMDQRKYQ